MIINNRNIEVQKTGTSVSVPSDPLSRLRYFLNCMCSVVPALNEGGKLSSITNYMKPINLNNAQIDSLMQLCKVCFIALNDKCIFMAPQLCDSGNQFFNIKQINNVLAVSQSVAIGGKIQNVTKIMAYTRDWIDRNFLDAMRELEARKRVQIVVKDDCSIM